MHFGFTKFRIYATAGLFVPMHLGVWQSLAKRTSTEKLVCALSAHFPHIFLYMISPKMHILYTIKKNSCELDHRFLKSGGFGTQGGSCLFTELGRGDLVTENKRIQTQ